MWFRATWGGLLEHEGYPISPRLAVRGVPMCAPRGQRVRSGQFRMVNGCCFWFGTISMIILISGAVRPHPRPRRLSRVYAVMVPGWALRSRCGFRLWSIVGLVGVVLTQILAERRERQRWREYDAREERRWQRERDARTHEARATAYAELIGAIEAFDFVLYHARQIREANQPLDDHQTSSLRAVMSETQHALGAVNLHVPCAATSASTPSPWRTCPTDQLLSTIVTSRSR